MENYAECTYEPTAAAPQDTMTGERPLSDEAARSLNTVFHRSIRAKVREAIAQYALIEPGDRIAVCVSGGKDSLLLAKVLQEVQAHGSTPFSLRFLSMDPGYSPENRARLEENAATLQLPLEIFQTEVFRIAERHAKNPCFLCAKMRRGWLYTQARALGCNKIALGHHFDDVAETILMGMLYGGQVQTMMPKLRADHYPGMQLIRPLYLVHERDIRAWADAIGLSCLDCACAVSARRGEGEGSKRAEVKALLARLGEGNPQIRQNIVNSVKNIDLTRVIGYHIGDTKSNFLDFYNDEDSK